MVQPALLSKIKPKIKHCWSPYQLFWSRRLRNAALDNEVIQPLTLGWHHVGKMVIWVCKKWLTNSNLCDVTHEWPLFKGKLTLMMLIICLSFWNCKSGMIAPLAAHWSLAADKTKPCSMKDPHLSDPSDWV